MATDLVPETVEIETFDLHEEEHGHGVLRAVLVAVGIAAVVAAVVGVLTRRRA